MRVVNGDGWNAWAFGGDAIGGAAGPGLGGCGTGQAWQVFETANVELRIAEDHAQARGNAGDGVGVESFGSLLEGHAPAVHLEEACEVVEFHAGRL